MQKRCRPNRNFLLLQMNFRSIIHKFRHTCCDSRNMLFEAYCLVGVPTVGELFLRRPVRSIAEWRWTEILPSDHHRRSDRGAVGYNKAAARLCAAGRSINHAPITRDAMTRCCFTTSALRWHQTWRNVRSTLTWDNCIYSRRHQHWSAFRNIIINTSMGVVVVVLVLFSHRSFYWSTHSYTERKIDCENTTWFNSDIVNNRKLLLCIYRYSIGQYSWTRCHCIIILSRTVILL